MPATIREVEPTDLDSLHGLDAECFPLGNLELEPAKPGEIERGVQDGQILVAEVENRIVGFLQYGLDSDGNTELISLAISGNFRGEGIGSELMTRFLEIAASKDGGIWCVTAPRNLAMRGLLERFEFTKQANLEDYFGPGKDRVRYLR